VLDERDERIATQDIDASPAGPEAHDALADFLERACDVEAVGHRLVHGGPDITRPTVVDDALRRRLDAVAQLAPMHVPAALDAIDLARARLPGVPHVACVDTAFHADMPEPARTYALPRRSPKRRRHSSATASTVSPTPGRSAAPPSCSEVSRPACT